MKSVELLSINEMKKFSKGTYQELIKSDMSDLLPEMSKQYIDDRSRYISNMLNNEVPRFRGRKTQTNN